MFIGVDVGTTNFKAALFDEEGTMLAERTRPNPASRRYGWDGVDPFAAFETVKELIGELAEDGRGRGVKGVAFTSMGETVFPVDEKAPLMEGICWYETCTTPQYEAMCARLSKDRIHRITSMYPSWIFSASKIMKVRDEFPDVWRRARYFMDVSGFMAFMLTGEAGFEASIACRTALLDVPRGRWSPTLIGAAGLEGEGAEKLPPLKYPGEPWGGGLLASLAEELGLPPGIAVTTGGQDHIAAAAGAAVRDLSSAMISIGTSAAFYSPVLRETFGKDPYLSRPFLAGGYSAFPDGCYMLAGMAAGGICMDWFIRRVLGRGYDWLDKFEPGRTDALFMPNLRAIMEGLPPGGFTCLSDRDTGATMFQSIMESLAFECRYTLTEAFKAKGLPDGFREIVMLGGGALNKPFTQIVAHALSCPVKIPRYPQSAAAFGCALAAGVAAGHFKSWDDAMRLVGFGDLILPEEASGFGDYLNEKYNRHLKAFRSI